MGALFELDNLPAYVFGLGRDPERQVHGADVTIILMPVFFYPLLEPACK